MIEHDTIDLREPAIVAKNQQNSIDTVNVFKDTYNPQNELGDRPKLDPRRENVDQMVVIRQQNHIIESLTKEVELLKERLKEEQKDKFRLAIQLEQLKRSVRSQDEQKVDKGVMTYFSGFEQVITNFILTL